MSQPLLTEAPEKAKQRIARRESQPASARSFQGGINPILQLQRKLGNQHVAQLIKAKRLTPDGKVIGLQPKLTVGAADDRYEQEADRIARQVVSMPDSVAMASLQQMPQVEGESTQAKTLQSRPLPPLAASITPFVQRQMGREEEIEEEKDKEEDKEELLQAKFFNKSAALPFQRQIAAEREKTEPVQAKLSIQRDILLGEEAKNQVLQTMPLAASIAPFAQRQTENNEELEDHEPSVQAKFLSETDSGSLLRQTVTEEEESEAIRAKSAASLSDSFEAGDSVESLLSQSKGSGSQLPDPVRTYMEPRFGVDFSHVNVHTGSNAAQMNQAIGAQAFTHGSDIYFGAGTSPSNLELTAHELTHVVQQTGAGPLQAIGLNGLSSTNAAVQATRGQHIQRLDFSIDNVVDTAGTAWEGLTSAPSRIAGAVGEAASEVGEAASEVVEFGYNQLIALLEEYAPEFLAFLRAGPVEFIKEHVLEALDSLLGGLVTDIRREGLVGALRGLFGESFGGIATIISDLRAGNCGSLFTAIGSIINFAETALGPFVGDLRDFLSNASAFFSDIWGRFGQPFVDFIGGVAGEFWDGLVSMANSFWEVTAGVRATFNDVWEEFKLQFDLAWDSGVDAIGWLMAKAGEAWEAIKAELGPALVPLEILAGLLSLFTPLGPFVAMAASYYAVSAAITWVRDNWGDVRQFFIDARESLYNDVFPAILSGVDALSEALNNATQWMVEQVQALAASVREIATALSMAPLLDAFTDFISGLASDVEELRNWAAEEFMGLVQEMRNVLRQLHETLRPLYGLLAALILFPINPFLLPVVLAGWFWRLTPDCIKAPVIDWIIDLMRAAIQAMPSFSGFGEWWPQVREQIISTLGTIASLPMEQKIAATNRVAKMMTLEDVEWIGNLVQAAIQAPRHFMDQMMEELTGMDLTKALPFERTEVRAPVAATAVNGTSNQSSGLGVLSQPTLSYRDISVDAIGRFDIGPRLLASAGLTRDGEVEFGDRGPGFASLDSIRAEMAAGSAAENLGPEGAAGLPETPSFAGMTHEEETEARLQALMDQPMSEECPRPEEAQQPAVPGAIPRELKFGPLTQTQRARYTLNQMGKGLAKWFDCNKAWLIPSIILAVVALIAAEILTGGAITAALPAIMEILTAVLLGVAAVRAAYYMAEYIALAAPGDILGGARSLARSFAVVAVEAVFALLFNIGSVVKALRGGLRNALREAAAAAKAFGQTTVKAAQTLGRVAVRGVQTAGRNVRHVAGAVLREGRLIMEGIGEGIGRGIRSLDDLARRLWNRLRFRRFKLQRTGRSIQLWGYINPWILLSNGEITWVDELASGGVMGERATARVGDDIIEGLLVRGSKANPDYRHIADVFAQQAVSEANVIHHAIEQQVMKRFPGIFTTAQIHAASNLRTILRGVFNSEVHLSKVRILWNAFYTELEAARAAAGLSDDAIRAAFMHFRSSVDSYIRHMQNFMSTDAAVVAAAARNDQDAVRRLLSAESDRFLGSGFTTQAVKNALL